MKFCTLMSGSKGNISYIQTSESKILIDIGASCKTVEKLLESIGVLASDIDAIFITHEHSDHCKGLNVFANKYGTEVFTHKDGADALINYTKLLDRQVTIFDKSFEYKDCSIDFYNCSHDVKKCIGYKVINNGKTITTTTDLGIVDKKLLNFIAGSDLCLLESNHDITMLNEGNYPNFLKRRITGDFGHLSNEQAGQVIKLLPDLNTRHVLLGHLSLINNTPEIAFNNALKVMKDNDITETDLEVDIAMQYQRSEIFNV